MTQRIVYLALALCMAYAWLYAPQAAWWLSLLVVGWFVLVRGALWRNERVERRRLLEDCEKQHTALMRDEVLAGTYGRYQPARLTGIIVRDYPHGAMVAGRWFPAETKTELEALTAAQESWLLKASELIEMKSRQMVGGRRPPVKAFSAGRRWGP